LARWTDQAQLTGMGMGSPFARQRQGPSRSVSVRLPPMRKPIVPTRTRAGGARCRRPSWRALPFRHCRASPPFRSPH